VNSKGSAELGEKGFPAAAAVVDVAGTGSSAMASKVLEMGLRDSCSVGIEVRVDAIGFEMIARDN
jgi:hypothetical protein